MARMLLQAGLLFRQFMIHHAFERRLFFLKKRQRFQRSGDPDENQSTACRCASLHCCRTFVHRRTGTPLPTHEKFSGIGRNLTSKYNGWRFDFCRRANSSSRWNFMRGQFPLSVPGLSGWECSTCSGQQTRSRSSPSNRLF